MLGRTNRVVNSGSALVLLEWGAPVSDDNQAAERAIRRKLLEYCRGIDRGDADLVASVYHPDATDDHGAFTGPGVDFANYATQRLRKHTEATWHMIGDPLIEFVGADLAHVETYVQAVHRCSDGDGQYLERFGGRYVDRFECRSGHWAIAHRLCIHEWDCLERIRPAFPAGRFTEGRRDRSDPAYTVHPA